MNKKMVRFLVVSILAAIFVLFGISIGKAEREMVILVKNETSPGAIDQKKPYRVEKRVLGNLETSMALAAGTIELTENYLVADNTELIMNLSYSKEVIYKNVIVEVEHFSYYPKTDSWAWEPLGQNPDYLDAGYFKFSVFENNPNEGVGILKGFDLKGVVTNPSNYIMGWYELSLEEIVIFMKACGNLIIVPNGDLYLLVSNGFMSSISTSEVLWMIEINYEEYSIKGIQYSLKNSLPVIPMLRQAAETANLIIGNSPFVVILEKK